MEHITRKIKTGGSFRLENEVYHVPPQFATMYGKTVSIVRGVSDTRVLLYADDSLRTMLGYAECEQSPCGEFQTYRVFRSGHYYMFQIIGTDAAEEFDDVLDCKRRVARFLADTDED